MPTSKFLTPPPNNGYAATIKPTASMKFNMGTCLLAYSVRSAFVIYYPDLMDYVGIVAEYRVHVERLVIFNYAPINLHFELESMATAK